MKSLNLKTILRNYLGFINFRTMIKLTMWWLWPRRNRVFFIFEGREYTYKEVFKKSQDFARFFASERDKLVANRTLPKEGRLSAGIYLDNIPEFLFASLGGGLSNSILFAINTGFRGETLSRVINDSGITMLIVNSSTINEVERIKNQINISERDILYAGSKEDLHERPYRILDATVSEAALRSDIYNIPRIDNFSPVIVIYTSGMTGVPKGVPCSHVKMIGAGSVVQTTIRLNKKDRGYISMPLFHSNAWYIGILPQMLAGGSFVLKRRFSASAFEDDILKHGVTFMNYVGQPIHYIIDSLEKKYGSPESVQKALSNHPRKKLRIAYGNGASVIDREKFKRYFGMEHVYEIYGSTEAVITTANRPGDPVESLGEALKSVIILDENGNECKPATVDENGRLKNYDAAVGEICRRVGENNLRFEGYFGNNAATSQKFRNGIYHSGDIGHIRIFNNRRYLYFNGRTDDWIRKDGENFSAENVLEYAQNIPGVDIAIAYGAPCDVADEKVMVALQIRKGTSFNPDDAFEWLMKQQKEGGMDPKWMPDFIRIIEGFPMTNTNKVVIRPYKSEHYNLEKNPDMQIFYRSKGDTTYSLMTREKYKTIKESFIKTGREALLG